MTEPSSSRTSPRHATIERRLHELFEVSILAKGLFALSEFLSGLGLLLVKAAWIVDLARWLTARELSEDPADRVANWLMGTAEHFSLHAQEFWAVYLMGHGLIKLAVVGALMRGWLWAYPASILVLLGFIAYQTERFVHTGSWLMAGLTLFDLMVIWLIRHEWKTLELRKTR